MIVDNVHSEKSPVIIGGNKEAIVREIIKEEIGVDQIGVFLTSYGERYVGFVQALDSEKLVVLGYYSHEVPLGNIIAVKACGIGECVDFDMGAD